MRIAIHHVKGSFSDRWVEYCENNKIDYKLVNAYDTDIIEQLSDCDGFMWHFHHASYKDNLFAKQLLYSLEMSGKEVFPNYKTCWHFDDKVGEKYLFESLNIEAAKAFVFYDKASAYSWAQKANYPIVFKLRGGAGASNVRLVRNLSEANKLIKRCFGRGFKSIEGWERFKEKYRLFRKGNARLKDLIYTSRLLFYTPFNYRMLPIQKGYVYFQEFIPDCDSDIRVIITGDKAFAIKRMVRENDFRASGSGNIIYDKSEINEDCVKAAFSINEKIQSQSIAFDFITDSTGRLYVVEISYGYSMHGYDKCPGFWTKDLQWHEDSPTPQYWQIENLISRIKDNRRRNL